MRVFLILGFAALAAQTAAAEDFAASRAICDRYRTPIPRHVQGEAYTPYIGADMNAECTALDARIAAKIAADVAARQAADAEADLAKLRESVKP
jgi:hypothetical protein